MEETPVVVDANVILSSAIKAGGVSHTRILMLLLDPGKILYIPKYLVEEVESKIEEIARRKNIDPEVLRNTIRLLLAAFTMVEDKEYKHRLREAEGLVFDPSDAPYVALALYLAEKHGRALILTYNLGDYKTGELEKRGVKVLTPREA